MTARVLRVLAATVLAGVALLGFAPGPAWAHATLVGSSPEQGEWVDQLPTEVVLEFSQEMSAPAYVVVTAPDGRQLTTGEPVVDGAEVRQTLAAADVDGEVTVALRVVSSDGHPVTGQVVFGVGEAPATGAVGLSGAPLDTATAEPAPDAGELPAEPGGDSESPLGPLAVVPLLLVVAAGAMWWLSLRADP